MQLLTREIAALLMACRLMTHNHMPQQPAILPGLSQSAAVVCSHQDLQKLPHWLMPRLSCRLQVWLQLTSTVYKQA